MKELRTIPGYRLISCLYEGQPVCVWRGTRDSDALQVVLKLAKGGQPQLQQVVRLKQEYAIARNLPVNGIVRALDLLEFDGGCVLVLEDVEGTSLDRVIAETPLSTEQALAVAAELAGILGEIHSHDVVHKDIKPGNIIVARDGLGVRITDFGIASLVLKNAQDTAAILRPEGTLAYISPEQTGRMNCRVDWRSDLYSLGVTLFHLFTGRLPFKAEDPLALIHAHIARVAPHASEVDPSIPRVIGAIIAKLLAKSPDERYQNATGLKTDLLLCLESYRASGEIAAFPLGRFDISDKFHIPQKLYGRERELARLLAAFESIAGGRGKMVAICGYSGIGKSALVHELQRPIVKRHGYFVLGKFDQFNQHTPYSSLIQAFRELMRQVLSQSSERVLRLKAKLSGALGENAQVIANVIPELAAVIGQPPKAAELPAAESQNRFTTLFRSFTQACASMEHPLCVFLDDLQWADQASLKLIADIMADPETRHVLLLGAYRDNEIHNAHPLAKALDSIAGSGVDVEALLLTPLSEADVCSMVQDTFSRPREDAAPLAAICMARTGGNPFFLAQFLRRLYEEGGVAFDSRLAEWRWDAEKIRAMQITDNVVTLMAEKILFFSERGKTALKLAACIGGTFSVSALAVVSGKTQGDMLQDLDEGIKEGLIIQVETAMLGGNTAAPAGSEGEDGKFRFLHDRVQQAAYSLFNDAEKRVAHLKVGRLLLENVSPVAWGSQLFDIVFHLNLGAGLIDDPAERTELARLNLEAGRRAKGSGAFEPAYRYLNATADCLPDNPWETAYGLTLNYHLEQGEVAYLCGLYEECYALCNSAFARARELLERVRVHEVLILAKRSEGKNREAVDCALSILQQLGQRYPERPTERHLILPILKNKWLLRGKTDADLLSLTPLQDPHKQAILRVMTKAASSTYITDPLLAALWIFAEMEITIKYGRSRVTAYAYGVYGLLLSGVLREYDEGSRFARLADLLVDADASLEARGKTLVNTALFAQPWRLNRAEIETRLWEAYHHALAEGDPEFAAISLYSVTQTLPWIFGDNLAAQGEKLDEYAGSLKKLQQDRVNQWSAVYRQTVWNATDPAVENPALLTGKFADEAETLANFDAHGDKVGKALFFVNKLILCCIFREFTHAAAYVACAAEYSQALTSQLTERQYCLYSNLVALELAGAAGALERRKALKRARKAHKLLRKMESDASPISHHAPLLLEAEIMRVGGKPESAADLYDAAIGHAKACGHHYEEALANELCGRFHLARGKLHIAEGYLQRAFLAYRKWGSMAKLVRMQKHYAAVGFPRIDSAPAEAESGSAAGAHPGALKAITPGSSLSSTGAEDRHLDLETVLKATRAISGEIVLARLLEELLKIVLENAGAQRGVLLLREDDELVVEGEIGGGAMAILQSVPLAGYQNILRPVVNYVHRTHNSVVLDDALGAGEYTHDPYLANERVRSLLCMPIMNKGEFTGMLYLENNAVPGAFTVQRLEILKVMAAQIAISIENARLYESIEKKVDERTRQLQEKSEQLNRANKEMAREIEQRRMLEDELRRLATTDSLTGLLVRRQLFELGVREIERARRNAAPLALIVLDIDHFKSINDTFGHAIGDEVLKTFSGVFCDSLRTVDIVCRFGGEEFVAILPGAGAQAALEVAERLRRNVEAGSLALDAMEIRYTISIGLAVLEDGDTQLNQLIKRADDALYQAKKSGRNRVVLAPCPARTAEAEA